MFYPEIVDSIMESNPGLSNVSSDQFSVLGDIENVAIADTDSTTELLATRKDGATLHITFVPGSHKATVKWEETSRSGRLTREGKEHFYLVEPLVSEVVRLVLAWSMRDEGVLPENVVAELAVRQSELDFYSARVDDTARRAWADKTISRATISDILHVSRATAYSRYDKRD